MITNQQEKIVTEEAIPQPENQPQPELKIDLEPCPCGKVPEGLMIEMQERGKYGRTMGDCCAEWAVEFRNGYTADQQETLKKAAAAWNAAPRVGPAVTGEAEA